MQKALDESAAAQEASRAEKERMALESTKAIKAIEGRLAAEAEKNGEMLLKLKAATTKHTEQMEQTEK